MLGLSGTVLTLVQSYRGNEEQIAKVDPFPHAEISVNAWKGMCLVTLRCPHAPHVGPGVGVGVRPGPHVGPMRAGFDTQKQTFSFKKYEVVEWEQ